MSEDGKLVNLNIDFKGLEGLSESARILVKRLADELGAFTKPHHARRLARAKADAAIIKAESANKITEIQERGLRRMVIEEGKRQANIEAITKMAIPHVKEDAKPDEIESDWISDFFDKCRLVSDSEMQRLWARLLAEEGNAPGSVSKRSLALLSSLDKKDAELFTKFSSFIWRVGDLASIIFEINNGAPFKAGVSFDVLKHLDSIGLVSLEAVANYVRQGFGKYTTIFYYGRALTIEFPQDINNNLQTGKVMLTAVGQQLARICGAKPNEEYYFEIVEKLFSENYVLSSRIDGRSF